MVRESKSVAFCKMQGKMNGGFRGGDSSQIRPFVLYVNNAL